MPHERIEKLPVLVAAATSARCPLHVAQRDGSLFGDSDARLEEASGHACQSLEWRSSEDSLEPGRVPEAAREQACTMAFPTTVRYLRVFSMALSLGISSPRFCSSRSFLTCSITSSPSRPSHLHRTTSSTSEKLSRLPLKRH